MPRYLWLRIAVVAAVIGASVWYVYPPRRTINLGLDLQGGIHLVLGVDVDKALENVVERTGTDVRAALEKKGIGAQVTRQGTADLLVQLTSPTSFKDAQNVLADFPFFTTRSADAAAGRFELTLTEQEAARLRDFAVRQGVETIRNRVDQFGVAEPTIQRQGENRILVQLPGIQDPARAKALIGKTAVLEFKLVDEAADVEKAVRGELPPGDELLSGRHLDRQTKAETKVPYVVKKRVLMTGDLIQNAEVRIGDSGEPYVSLTFNSQGTRVFGDLTEQNVGKRLAIVLDGNVHSAPVIRERIPSGQAQITGGFTPEEARDLAIVLRAGALPAPVQVLEERTVGPSLGADSIRKGIISTVTGALAVVLFMVIYYRLSGVIADVAVLLNLLILLACMAAFHATLTLPGIAGIVLTIGMAVDTNILIFERIREEFRLGKSIRAAIDAGFKRAFTTVIDTHVTVVVSAVILYQFGTGPVKGFAVSLMIGIMASLFTAVFFTRLVFDLIYMGRRRRQTLSI
ncbi:MAG TPA: protein translocase subunit SecD [Methylomirabilota bacterium]|jgi:preprotein translocase subunit SecD|nr:protein translocase subunit SecD [Methylomirabilota bacterium]